MYHPVSYTSGTAGRYIHVDDFLVAQLVDDFDKCPDTVAVGGNQQTFAMTEV